MTKTGSTSVIEGRLDVRIGVTDEERPTLIAETPPVHRSRPRPRPGPGTLFSLSGRTGPTETTTAGTGETVERVGSLSGPTFTVGWLQMSRTHGTLTNPLARTPMGRRVPLTVTGTAP